jgi:hypothetical protein
MRAATGNCGAAAMATARFRTSRCMRAVLGVKSKFAVVSATSKHRGSAKGTRVALSDQTVARSWL